MINFRHVLKKRLLAEDIITGPVDTFEGEKINLKKEVDKIQVEFTGANGANTTATVLNPSINAKNGIIHKIDTILLEPTTPTPTLYTPNPDAAVESPLVWLDNGLELGVT